MHDVVSHQVSLIAMQAGALQMTTTDELSRQTAMTIRALSTRTLDELRDLVGALRTATDGADEPDLDTLLDLVRDSRWTSSWTWTYVPQAVRPDRERRLPDGPGGADQRAQTRVRRPGTVRIVVEDGELRVCVDNEPPINGSPPTNGADLPSAATA